MHLKRIGSVEFFQDTYVQCDECDHFAHKDHGEPCDCPDEDKTELTGVWYWNCQPGCLPDSDPFGPFKTITDAVMDADEVMDLGLSKDDLFRLDIKTNHQFD